MHIIEAFGRIFLSTLFLFEAVRKFFYQEETIEYMESFGVPEILFYPSIAFELIVPLFLIAGYKTKIMASILALFVLAVTLIFHAHHIFSDAMQFTALLKNFAIIGGLLVIISNKPQICSFDYYLENKK